MRIRWTPEAAENLAQIDHYLQLNRSALAQQTVQEIYDGIYSLQEMPYRGRPGRVAETRELVFRKAPFVAVYTIEHETVVVVSIRHTSREPFTE